MKKQIETIKKQKQFKAADVIVYAAVILLIVALFLAFFKKSSSGFSGVDAYCDGEKIMSYRFEKGTVTVSEGWEDRITVTKEDGVINVRFTFGDEYNLLEISPQKKSAKMVRANCSYHKECVDSFPRITSADGFVICMPHRLHIVGVGESEGEVVVG